MKNLLIEMYKNRERRLRFFAGFFRSAPPPPKPSIVNYTDSFECIGCSALYQEASVDCRILGTSNNCRDAQYIDVWCYRFNQS